LKGWFSGHAIQDSDNDFSSPDELQDDVDLEEEIVLRVGHSHPSTTPAPAQEDHLRSFEVNLDNFNSSSNDGRGPVIFTHGSVKGEEDFGLNVATHDSKPIQCMV
jgi:hypothetical protein